MPSGTKKVLSAFGIIAVLFLAVLMLSSEATFYEVCGKVLWGNKGYRQADAYVLYGELSGHTLNRELEISKEPHLKTFEEEYALLERETKDSGVLLDEKEVKKTQKALNHKLRGLIKKYKERSIRIDRKGEFCLNVSPGISYYILVLKKNQLFEKAGLTRFWLQKVYFKPGDVLNAKEIIFNESNMVTW